MAPNYSSLHQQLVDAIIAALPKKSRSTLAPFVTAFYAQATVEDLKAIDPAHAATIAQQGWDFTASRSKKGPKISIESSRLVEGDRSVTRTQVMVLNTDMPFLVDSLSALITSLGLTIHRLLHPILPIARDAKGARQSGKKATQHESLIYLELSPLPTALTAEALSKDILHTLSHVQAAVTDWVEMRDRALVVAESFSAKHANVPTAEAQEVRDLLRWLADNHYVFLGLADYRASGKKLLLDTKTALGVYRLPATEDAPIERAETQTTSDVLSVLKASCFSEVHRHVPMDMVVVRRFDSKGKFIGETRLLGLFASTVYYRETQNIPFIRRKAAKTIARAGFDPAGHSGKTLKTTLEFMPRDELFQMDEERLFQTAMGIVALDAQPQVKLFTRVDPFERFVSAMVYIPRERFSSSLREEISRMLERAYGGRFSTFYTQMTDAPLARVHILIETTPGQVPNVDEAALEQYIADRANSWADALRDAVVANLGENEGEALAQTFAGAFPLAYINTHGAAAAAHDIRQIIACLKGDGIALELYRVASEPAGQMHLKCYTQDLHAELSAIIPSLEHMGCTVLDATPYVITPRAPFAPVLLRDFTLRVSGGEAIDLATAKGRIEDTMHRIWRGVVDNDTLNALVISAGITAREVEILRAYSRYLQQLNFPYSQSLIATALRNHANLAAMLVALFDARFNPALKGAEQREAELRGLMEAALETVTNLGEDRIIRRILALISATLRTNFYQTENGAPKPYLSLKLRSSLVPDMPLPVPFAEIFVTSMRMEGIHLRGGAVARGGLRWSDRPEDFRTEVLGLVKAQMVKNAVIVPQGAKGGFILRQPPAERDALQAEGIACYQMFLRGLLDITDNIVKGKLTPPTLVRRHDGDDPYLVVAADKGTATFSDIANALSAEYGFWLGDAFASGGSVGYDHKVMAITARGGWISVERHFREMGMNIGSHEARRAGKPDVAPDYFTAIGIGDMSGDVFGNGALLSPNMRLVAAFNHRHIFIDPNPDAASSYAERARLFALPRSGWNDYNASLISKGGGVYERTAKSITLSKEARAALGTEVTSATPDELIRIILCAPVDLLWNGGIGTYVKASFETHEQVGDRANNSVRVDGNMLRCKIIGEGGNLGLTQRGRIEYARKGGRLNTDAIDNSGGVDCSDHEVNIKIALGGAVSTGKLSVKQRDSLLKKMTDDVAHLVLIDNKLQTQAISIAELQGTALLEPAAQLMRQLEGENFLNRAVEALPDDKQLAELRTTKHGLTRPEIAVLLAYAKMSFFHDLAGADALDAPYYEADLLRYFPKAMGKDFTTDIRAHRLRREIVATMITNSIVNRTGFSFAHSLMRATGLPAADIAQAYIATRDLFDLRSLWAEIESLNGEGSAALQSQLFTRTNEFIEHQCLWFLQHVPQPMQLDDVLAAYRAGTQELAANAEALMTETLRKSYQLNVDDLIARGASEALARRMAGLEILASACDIVDIARLTKRPLIAVGQSYFALGAMLKLGWLRRTARALAAEDYWQQLAVKSLITEFFQAQRNLCLAATQRFSKGKPAEDIPGGWSAQAEAPLARYLNFIGELRTQSHLDYPMLIVALRQVQAITSL